MGHGRHIWQKVVSQDTTVCFRAPNHPLTLTALGELNEPVILTSANRSGGGEATTVEEVLAQLGGGIDLLVDDGPVVDANPSTVVKVDRDPCGKDHVTEHRCTVLREGAVPSASIHKLCARMILFVCTGNTCRSPMAERLCEKLLARRLGCSIDELEKHGFVVLSAGVAAGDDIPASTHAQTVMRKRGLDLRDHRSQQINETHVQFADHIFALTRRHREAILSYWPNADTRLNVLRLDGGDISDPIGGSEAVYEDCARQLEENWRRKSINGWPKFHSKTDRLLSMLP